MRHFLEPTSKDLLRQPTLLGLPMSSLAFLTTLTIGLEFGLGLLFPEQSKLIGMMAIGVAVVGYFLLRIANQFLKSGWDQSLLFAFERLVLGRKEGVGDYLAVPSKHSISPPDTLDEEKKLNLKVSLERELSHLEPGQSKIFRCKVTEAGASMFEFKAIKPARKIRWKRDLQELVTSLTQLDSPYVYSLCNLPSTMNPLWLFSQLEEVKNVEIITAVHGVEQSTIKRRIETARWLNSSSDSVAAVDSEVSFEQASQVLRGLSTGDDRVLEISVVIVAKERIKTLDSHYFVLEKNPALTLLSVLGLRARLHRSFYVRLVTAEDFIFNITDPKENGVSILKTKRDNPLYFNPKDERLDALHWLVVGGTGTGKSFFVGSVLWRILKNNVDASLLFIDNKRSFRRFVREMKGPWIEPETFEDLEKEIGPVFSSLDMPRVVAGIELSELQVEDQTRSATFLLSQLTKYLIKRSGKHVIYVVMDECWSLLASDSIGVQKAFREYRKLEVGVIAITQSLSDFSSNAVGKSMIQNAPIKVLLRQDEDIRDFKYILGLSEKEIETVKGLTKVNGEFSECLIKTPFLTRFGVLRTLPDEHEILRTDNLRSELVREKLEANEVAHV